MDTLPCNLTPCKPAFTSRKCMCYASPGKMGDEAASDQFCGYYDDDAGAVYGCDPGCCGDGCPGQCKEVAPRPPERFMPDNSIAITDDDDDKPKIPKKYLNIEMTLLILVALSTFSIVSESLFFVAGGKSRRFYIILQVIVLLAFTGTIIYPFVKGT